LAFGRCTRASLAELLEHARPKPAQRPHPPILVDVPFAYEPTLNWEHDGYRWCNVEDAVALFHWGNVGAALIALVGRPG
jgi:hypothetical protein